MENRYRVTGLMSGSSMDGVDLACCEFSHVQERWNYMILAAETYPYPTPLLEKLHKAIHWSRRELELLDLETGEYYASLLNRFHKIHHLKPGLIASHGHTILHDPGKGITLQVGNGKVMAGQTGITVVNDFRKEDVAQGGQGAPLVPLGDRLLFGEYGACLNLGGFANISYEADTGQRIAFDIGPANVALNWLSGLSGKPFDHGGTIAGSGRVDENLLLKLNHLAYYSILPPKSLGREWFQEFFLPLLEATSLPVQDRMATVVEHLAMQTGRWIERSGARKILVTGGGTYNITLMERIGFHTRAELFIPDRVLVDYKEALIFALLGLLRTRGEINCLASVTGGRHDLCTGIIHSPINDKS
jgi:anhydro-N-acetylmuramic acid kinase